MNKRNLISVLLVLTILFCFAGCRRRVVSDETADDIKQQQIQSMSGGSGNSENIPVEVTTTNEQNNNDAEEGTEPDRGEQSDQVKNPNSHPNSSGVNGSVADSSSGTKVTMPQNEIKNGITVNLNTNGGECNTTSVLVDPKKTYGSLPTPARRGYSFAGWYTSRVGGTKITASSKVTSSLEHTIYAHWDARSGLTLTFDGNGGRVKSSESNKEVFTGDSYGSLPTPLREGYNFLGWYSKSTGGTKITSFSTYTSSSDTTIYAQWEYDAVAYWKFKLTDINNSMYACQKKSIYVEYDADNIAIKQCSLVTVTSSTNISANVTDTSRTDKWVNEKNPPIVLKVVSDFSNASTYAARLSSRFPGKQIVIVPMTAVNGTDLQKLYYNLYFYKVIYPDWCTGVDINKMSSELGVTGTISH